MHSSCILLLWTLCRSLKSAKSLHQTLYDSNPIYFFNSCFINSHFTCSSTNQQTQNKNSKSLQDSLKSLSLHAQTRCLSSPCIPALPPSNMHLALFPSGSKTIPTNHKSPWSLIQAVLIGQCMKQTPTQKRSFCKRGI